MTTSTDRIVFPAMSTFGELFSRMTPRKATQSAPIIREWPSWEAGTWTDRAGLTRCYLRGGLTIDNGGRYTFFTVEPTDAVLAHADDMLHGSCDTLSFHGVVRADGTVLIVLQYGQIIGGVWLAVLPASELPS